MKNRSILTRAELFFLAAFLLSGVLFLVQVPFPAVAYLQLPMFGPALAVFLFLRLERTDRGAFWRERLALRWDGVTLLLLALPVVLQAGVSALTGGFASAWQNSLPDPRLTGLFLVWMLPAAFGEEIGWRGYLLPMLQQRFRPLSASLIVGLLWGAWHIPVRLGLGMPGLLLWFIQLMGFNLVFTVVTCRAKHSVWPAVGLHFLINVTSFFLASTAPSVQALLAAVWVAAGSAAFLLAQPAGEWPPEGSVKNNTRKQPTEV